MKAVYYIRTSSATNLDGDSETRQKIAIYAYAEKNGYEIVQGAYDEAVKGTDHIPEREGFSKLIDYCLNNDVKFILCENASRFARSVIVQEMGYNKLNEVGLVVIPVDAPDYFSNDDPSQRMIRQMLGVVAEFEKSNLVSKLRGARKRKKKENGKCEGRKSLIEIYTEPRYEKLLKLVGKFSKQGLSLAEVSKALADKGWVQPSKGKPFHRQQIWRFKQELLKGDKV